MVIVVKHMHSAGVASTMHGDAVHMRGGYASAAMTKTLLRQTAPVQAVSDSGAIANSVAQEEARQLILTIARMADVNLTEVARRAGLNQTTVTRSMKSGSPHPITARTLSAIAAKFGVPVSAGLLAALPPGRERTHDAGPPTPAQVVARQPVAALPRDVPIYEAVIVNRGPLFRLNPWHIDNAPRPPAIAAARKVFALRMPDESMSPWRRAGELVFIDPSRPIRRGDHALFHLADPSLPDEEPLCLVRLVDAAATAEPARQAVAYGATGPEEFLRGLQVTERLRVVEWEELLN